MEQGLSNIGIIGGGASGCCCAYFGGKRNLDITVIDFEAPLKTILATGGGRCNLAHAEYDFRELAKNYPRGEKFLYSVFSRFSTSDTIEMFEEIGIETYTQENGRIFPVSDSAKDVREKFLAELKKYKNIKFAREKALNIEKNNKGFKVVTDKSSYYFDKLVYAVGGHNGYDIIKRLGISIIEPKPSLVGLVTKEKFEDIKGIVLTNIKNNETGEQGDLLFTHFGVSGPLIYKLSSIFARKDMPYKLSFNLCSELEDLQTILNDNPHKFVKNILSDYLPQRFVENIIENLGINPDEKAHHINGQMRDKILDKIHNFEITVKSSQKDGETVTAGGVDLDKINPKTMESKEVENLYFCGEVIDVDGFCGGFNLQNCWSTGYIVAQNL